jgi:predicted nuclease with TOPRIM domain
MEKDTIPSISIIKEMTENIIKLQQENENLETQIKKLKAGRDHVLQKYEAFEREKSLADTDIFQKFVQVLNEKKRKIKELSQ